MMARIRKAVIGISLFALLVLAAFTFYNQPPVRERLEWRVEALQARIKYAISPPQEVIFIPREQNVELPPPSVNVIAPQVSPTQTENVIASTDEPEPTVTPTITPTPVPAHIQLAGVRHEYQTWNNCGPATLSMALSYWGWEGDQREVAAYTKPNPRDKNVSPDELAAFVLEQTEFEVAVRVGGIIQLLKELLAAGFPVMVEKGIEQEDGWLGHYVLVTGYDDGNRIFTLMDSLRGPDQVLDYDVMESQWHAFNYTYLVIYPPDREVQVVDLLGIQTDVVTNYQSATQRAWEQLSILSGRDLYFAWFNYGTNLVALQDYERAAAAYDQAFALYPTLPLQERPWRMLWYQFGPYLAYYYTERYQDVIDLATTTLNAMSEPVLEESYFWRAMARKALGDREAAFKDFRTSLSHNPVFQPSLDQLDQLEAGE
jgi:hypothetical protein